jgi:hypothetical protein
MKCVEIIELRLRCDDQVLNKLNILGLIAEVEKKMKSLTINLYRHGSLATDYRLYLIYNKEKIDVNGSPLGLYLVSALKEFGLINHSVWFEIDNSTVLNN